MYMDLSVFKSWRYGMFSPKIHHIQGTYTENQGNLFLYYSIKPRTVTSHNTTHYIISNFSGCNIQNPLHYAMDRESYNKYLKLSKRAHQFRPTCSPSKKKCRTQHTGLLENQIITISPYHPCVRHEKMSAFEKNTVLQTEQGTQMLLKCNFNQQYLCKVNSKN